MTNKDSKTIVVIGAGYFGISTVNRLSKKYPKYQIKLITLSNYTYSIVSSIRVPVFNKPEGTIIPLDEVVDNINKNVEIIIDEVLKFDTEKIELQKAGELRFDCLVIATGAQWPSPIGYTQSFKDDYKAYFSEQYKLLENAKHIVMIGGGYNNVELAGELFDKYEQQMKNKEKKITLIHSRDKLLPNEETYSEDLRLKLTKFFQEKTSIELKLNTRAKIATSTELQKSKHADIDDEITKKNKDNYTVELSDGTQIECDHVISSVGVTPSVPPNDIDNLTDKNGFIKIESTFQLSSLKDDMKGFNKIFAIGDVVNFSYKGLQGRCWWLNCLITNIERVLDNTSIDSRSLKTVERPSGPKMSFVSLGCNNGLGQIVLPFLGVVSAPTWWVIKAKSKNLYVEHANKLYHS